MAVRLKRKLGDVLKAEGLITEDEIVAALEQKKPRQKLGDALVEQGISRKNN